MYRSISNAQGVVDDSVNTKIPQHGQGNIGMHGFIQGSSRRIVDAIRSSDLIHFKEIEKS
jgi:hypothetical protein